jgi:hypothetical protein
MVNGQLLVVDSEVDETPLDRGRDLWRITRRGSVVSSMTTRFSRELTDVATDAANNWYFSDDTPFGGVRGRIFVQNIGADGRYGTADDKRRSFAAGSFGSTDPEGLAFGDGSLWISDGTSGKVYRIQPGPNGKIEGAGADDVITELDLTGLGVRDLEGLEYWSGRLLVLANQPNADILSVDATSGALLKVYDLSTANLRHPSAIAFGPSSDNPARRSFYVADRGFDNNTHPNENDGRIVEVQAIARPPNLIKNGGFERDRNRDGRPDSWTFNTHFTRNGLTHHDGSFSGRHRAPDDATYTVRQDLNDVVAGETYHFEGWTKIPAPGDAFTFRIRIVWFGANGARILTSNLDTFTIQRAQWTQSVRNVQAPAGTVRAKLVMSVSQLSKTIYVDGFSLTVVS